MQHLLQIAHISDRIFAPDEVAYQLAFRDALQDDTSLIRLETAPLRDHLSPDEWRALHALFHDTQPAEFASRRPVAH